MLKKNLFTIFSFKVVWLSCVFGEIYFNSFVGLIIGSIFLIIFLSNTKKKISALKIILIFSLCGYIFDSFLSVYGFYVINAQTYFLFLPIWFLILWPSFCCLLIEVLIFLKNKNIISTLLGLIFGPLSYYAGISLGIASYSGIITFVAMSFFWGLLMFAYANFN